MLRKYEILHHLNFQFVRPIVINNLAKHFLNLLIVHLIVHHNPKFFQLITESVYFYVLYLHNNWARLFDNLRHLDIVEIVYSTGSPSNSSTRLIKFIKSVFKVLTSVCKGSTSVCNVLTSVFKVLTSFSICSFPRIFFILPLFKIPTDRSVKK